MPSSDVLRCHGSELADATLTLLERLWDFDRIPPPTPTDAKMEATQSTRSERQTQLPPLGGWATRRYLPSVSVVVTHAPPAAPGAMSVDDALKTVTPTHLRPRLVHVKNAIVFHIAGDSTTRNVTPSTAYLMLERIMPRVFDDCDFFDDGNKENVGYFVRRPTASLRSEMDGTPVLLRRRVSSSLSSSGRRTPSPVVGLDGAARLAARTSTITPQDARKKVMQKMATKTKTRAPSAKAVARSNSSKKTETSKKAKSGGSQSLGIIRRPLRDITHLYLSERPNAVVLRRERLAREAQSTSVSMRFF
ncbi:hypothetical protein PybrP1_002013 [[Pythium] brassicae (nom. inval.)]|nr:hypothetical protein PybrP1_002013 [[Pythium] brassicae (nom. inval.)]